MNTNTRNIIIGIVVIVVVILIGFMMFRSKGASSQGAQGAATTTDQVQAQEVAVGTGAQATPGSQVSVLYVGELKDGTVFDSSAAHNNQPISFVLGAQGMIPGFQIGVNGMKEGGERLIAIPPSLAYGAQDVKDNAGKVIIPANSTIVFDVKLVKVGAASTSPATTTKK